MNHAEWKHLIDLDNRIKFDYPSEFAWTDKDKEVLKSTLFDLMWAYIKQSGHPGKKTDDPR